MPPTQTTTLRRCRNRDSVTDFLSEQSGLIEQKSNRSEAPPVLRAGAMRLQCREMRGGTVPHMPVETVGWEFRVQAAHERVARGLGEDRRRGDRRDLVVALDNGVRAQ